MKNIEKYITKHVHDNDLLVLLTNKCDKKGLWILFIKTNFHVFKSANLKDVINQFFFLEKKIQKKFSFPLISGELVECLKQIKIAKA